MIRIFLLRCWPALIPITIYLLWFWLARRKAKKLGETPPKFFSGAWRRTAIVSVLVMAIFLFIIPLSTESNQGTNYTPKQFIDGKLISEELD